MALFSFQGMAFLKNIIWNLYTDL